MKRHALFVGVNNYSDPSIQNLAFPSEDATELASVFRRLLKFDRVEKLINPAHSPDVEDAVESMAQGLGPGDLFLFFFAGHGFRVKENHVLVCAKDKYAKLEDEYAGLPVGLLKKIMRGPWNRMLVLDACQNDIRSTRGADCGAATRDLELIHALDDGAPGAGFQIVITSCSEGQKALEVSDLKHGLFTSALLDSVTSFADSRRRIDLEGLRTDLGARMGDLIVRYRLDGRQQPMFTMPTDAGGIILLDGVIPMSSAPQSPPSYHQPAAAPTLVTCPMCGKKNHPEDTFRCRKCGRDNLCVCHQDETTFLCAQCAAELKRKTASKINVESHPRLTPCIPVGEKAGERRTFKIQENVPMEFVWCPATTDDEWKKISNGADTFAMGSPTGEKGRRADEFRHPVRLTHGFW
ncbi:MAG: caspase family protein, partial [Kiritimatiellae bacterium]|nr:caspase family protein [Kiritimatiellia bacterium]